MTRKTRNILLGIAVVCALGIIGAGVGGFFLFRWLAQDPENILISVHAPLEVVKGEPFILEITLENTSNKLRKLHSIDIYNDYLKGIAIQKTEPPFSQSSRVPIDNTQSYEFMQTIPPQGKLSLKFHAVGVVLGDHSSSFDACIDSDVHFLTYPIRTIVK